MSGINVEPSDQGKPSSRTDDATAEGDNDCSPAKQLRVSPLQNQDLLENDGDNTDSVVAISKHIKVQDKGEAEADDSVAKKAEILARLAKMGARPMMPGTMGAPSRVKQVQGDGEEVETCRTGDEKPSPDRFKSMGAVPMMPCMNELQRKISGKKKPGPPVALKRPPNNAEVQPEHDSRSEQRNENETKAESGSDANIDTFWQTSVDIPQVDDVVSSSSFDAIQRKEEILDVRLAKERANLGSQRRPKTYKPSAKPGSDSVDGPKVMEIPIHVGGGEAVVNQTVEEHVNSDRADNDNNGTETSVTTNSVSEIELPNIPTVEIPPPQATISSTVLSDVSPMESSANYVEHSLSSTVTENKRELRQVEVPKPTLESEIIFETNTKVVTPPLLSYQESPELDLRSLDTNIQFTEVTRSVSPPALIAIEEIADTSMVELGSSTTYSFSTEHQSSVKVQPIEQNADLLLLDFTNESRDLQPPDCQSELVGCIVKPEEFEIISKKSVEFEVIGVNATSIDWDTKAHVVEKLFALDQPDSGHQSPSDYLVDTSTTRPPEILVASKIPEVMDELADVQGQLRNEFTDIIPIIPARSPEKAFTSASPESSNQLDLEQLIHTKELDNRPFTVTLEANATSNNHDSPIIECAAPLQVSSREILLSSPAKLESPVVVDMAVKIKQVSGGANIQLSSTSSVVKSSEAEQEHKVPSPAISRANVVPVSVETRESSTKDQSVLHDDHDYQQPAKDHSSQTRESSTKDQSLLHDDEQPAKDHLSQTRESITKDQSLLHDDKQPVKDHTRQDATKLADTKYQILEVSNSEGKRVVSHDNVNKPPEASPVKHITSDIKLDRETASHRTGDTNNFKVLQDKTGQIEIQVGLQDKPERKLQDKSAPRANSPPPPPLPSSEVPWQEDDRTAVEVANVHRLQSKHDPRTELNNSKQIAGSVKLEQKLHKSDFSQDVPTKEVAHSHAKPSANGSEKLSEPVCRTSISKPSKESRISDDKVTASPSRIVAERSPVILTSSRRGTDWVTPKTPTPARIQDSSRRASTPDSWRSHLKKVETKPSDLQAVEDSPALEKKPSRLSTPLRVSIPQHRTVPAANMDDLRSPPFMQEWERIRQQRQLKSPALVATVQPARNTKKSEPEVPEFMKLAAKFHAKNGVLADAEAR